MLSRQELKQIRTERERSFQDLSWKLDAMNRKLFESSNKHLSSTGI